MLVVIGARAAIRCYYGERIARKIRMRLPLLLVKKVVICDLRARTIIFVFR